MNNTLNILVAEDEPASARLIQELLKESIAKQFNLVYSSTLSDTLDILSKKKIDILLLDLGLPDSNGIDTFRKVNHAWPSVPIIIISTSKDESIATETIAEGAQDYFVKGSFDGNSLTKAIAYAIERKRNENELFEYAEIIKNSNDAIFSLTSEGIIKNINDAVENVYKYTRQDLIDESFLSLISKKKYS